MTVVFAGVGADDSNVNAHAPLYDDGRFEYVPIPEKGSARLTRHGPTARGNSDTTTAPRQT